MPSPFPGMDPFLEGQIWREFHNLMIAEIQATLVPALRPHYVARMDERVYLQYEFDESAQLALPDVTVLRETGRTQESSSVGTMVIAEPILLPLPMPEEVKEVFLEVRLRQTHEVVTVIELLSPANKRAGSKGREEYLAKREAVLLSRAHLAEIDLLRRGSRMPTTKPPPPCDYLALVSRVRRRPTAEVWTFTMRQRLPVIPIPLAGGDPDVPLNLQEVFNEVYARAGYDYSIDYEAPLDPALPGEDQAWLEQILNTPEKQADQ